jgi:hypothetical protein
LAPYGSRLQDDHGASLFLCGSDGEIDVTHTQPASFRMQPIMQDDPALATATQPDFNLTKSGQVPDSSSERFEGGFLGGEAGCITPRGMLSGAAIQDLFAREYAVPLYPFAPRELPFEAAVLDEIKSQTYDHDE